MKRLLVALAVALACSGVLLGQAPAPRIAFEVASVQVSTRPQPGMRGGVLRGNRYELRNATMLDMIRTAYDVQPDRITGGPSWLEWNRFDIAALAPENTPPDRLRAMLKALLAERFKLAVREETKEGPIYLLTLASRDGQLGPKLRRSTYPCPVPNGPPSPEWLQNCSSRVGYGTLTARGIPMEQLAQSIANFYGIGRLVVDRTDLTGRFDMDMEWAPMTQFRQPGNLDPPPDFADRAVNNLPTLFVALKEQLGLTLEPGRGPVRSIVIERVDRLTPD